VKNEVVLAYVSMHDSTRKMVERFVDALVQRGIKVRQFDLVGVDVGELAIALVDAATVVIGSPTFLVGPHPAAAYATMLTNALRPKTRFVSIIGSFSWAGKMVEQLTGMLGNLKVEVIEPVVAKGLPKDEDFNALDGLAEKIAEKHRAIGILK
jgi:flavorubredoxin